MKPAITYSIWTRTGQAMFLLICGLLRPAEVLAEDAAPLFAGESLIEATIEGPLFTLMNERDEANEYEGTFSYLDTDAAERRFDIKLRVRGKFRARKQVCDFAPIRLNFRKKQVKDSEFQGQNKLKLVTHCQSNGSYFQKYILREYLTYRLLMALTENSFRVRLLHITYVDTDSKRKTRTKYAFLIENEKKLGKRIDAKRTIAQSIEHSEVDQAQDNLVSVFEYFIGNTDYSAVVAPREIDCCHNMVLFRHAQEPLLPVPYDFDHAGLVDAPYAGPNPKLPIESVRQRYYRGACVSDEQLQSTFARFEAARDDIDATIDGLQQLGKRSRKSVQKYIDRFYEIIGSDKLVQREFLRRCYEPQELVALP